MLNSPNQSPLLSPSSNPSCGYPTRTSHGRLVCLITFLELRSHNVLHICRHQISLLHSPRCTVRSSHALPLLSLTHSSCCLALCIVHISVPQIWDRIAGVAANDTIPSESSLCSASPHLLTPSMYYQMTSPPLLPQWPSKPPCCCVPHHVPAPCMVC